MLIRAAIVMVASLLVAAPVSAHGDDQVHSGPLSVTAVGAPVGSPCDTSFTDGTQVTVRGAGFIPFAALTVTFASPTAGQVVYAEVSADEDGAVDVDIVLPTAETQVSTTGLLRIEGPGPDGHDPVLTARMSMQPNESLCGDRLVAAGAVVDPGETASTTSSRVVLQPDGTLVVPSSEPPLRSAPVVVGVVVFLASIGFLGFAVLKRRR